MVVVAFNHNVPVKGGSEPFQLVDTPHWYSAIEHQRQHHSLFFIFLVHLATTAADAMWTGYEYWLKPFNFSWLAHRTGTSRSNTTTTEKWCTFAPAENNTPQIYESALIGWNHTGAASYDFHVHMHECSSWPTPRSKTKLAAPAHGTHAQFHARLRVKRGSYISDRKI